MDPLAVSILSTAKKDLKIHPSGNVKKKSLWAEKRPEAIIINVQKTSLIFSEI